MNKSTLIKEGQRYGRLITIAFDHRIHKGRKTFSYWRCNCDCGAVFIVKGQSLLNGKTRSCGCLRKDLTKERFAKHNEHALVNTRVYKLLVIDITSVRIKSSLLMKCRCDCGKIKFVRHVDLVNNRIKSCGCLWGRSGKRIANLEHKQFDRLTVLQYFGLDNGYHKWICMCDCANLTVVGHYELIERKTHSCGCLYKELNGGVSNWHHMSTEEQEILTCLRTATQALTRELESTNLQYRKLLENQQQT